MADTIKIGNLDISAFKVGSSDCKIYIGDTLLYPQSTPPTPVSSCYEVIPQPISQYASTTYDSVYSFSDTKWYMKNNLSQYEEYGIYDIVENISSATTYDGKLAIVGTTEYQYSGGSWSVVGTYEDASVTYTIDDTYPSPYVGQELATTFKIQYADVEAIGQLNLRIRTADGGRLRIDTHSYEYMGSSYYNGTVTNDGEYYYFALPSEAPQSIIIDSIDYWESTPIHLIVSSKQASVEYSAKTAPSSALTYSSVEEMEAVSCPTVGIGQYCYTNGQVYKYTANEEWTTVQDSEIMIKSFNSNGEVTIMGCGYNNGEVKRYDVVSGATDIWLGNCITSFNTSIFGTYGLYDSLSALTITTIVPPLYVDGSSSLPKHVTEIKVPCNSVHSYRISEGWNGLSNIITTYEPNCQETINYKARLYSSNGTLLTEIPRSSASSGINLTSAETKSYASTTYRLELGDCFGRIHNGAFKNFTHIQKVIIPNNVFFWNNESFRGCTSLTAVTLPENYSSYISNNAFQGCNKLKNITIPSGTTGIYDSAFSGCTSLQYIKILRENGIVFLQNTNALANTNNCPIYVPANLVNTYKSDNKWKTYASRIQAIPEPTLQWVSIDSGDTIPKGNIYGIKISSQNAGGDFGNGFEIGTDSDNCAWFGGGKPTRAPQFTAYFYTITNGVSTLENSWDNGDKEFIFSNYSGANYYYEDGTKTAPYAIQLYMYA